MQGLVLQTRFITELPIYLSFLVHISLLLQRSEYRLA